MDSQHSHIQSTTHSAKPPFGVFMATTIVIFFLALSAADSIGFVPNYIDGTAPEAGIAESTQPDTVPTETSESLALSQLPMLGEVVNPVVATALPVRIKIDSIGLDLKVQNPDTRSIEKLDELLKDGPARYVDSAKLGTKGNIIVFAHSSRLPIVHNQMYKAFNKVPDLKAGDTITLEGDDGRGYVYSVIEVHKADAKDATIDLSPTLGTRLTLVTCDTLTGKSARFILTADFVGTVE